MPRRAPFPSACVARSNVCWKTRHGILALRPIRSCPKRLNGRTRDEGLPANPTKASRRTTGVIVTFVAIVTACDSKDERLPMLSDRPSSPFQELHDRRHWSGPTLANGVLTSELAGFCQSGLSIVLASCDGAGRPVVGRGLACAIDADGRVRVVYREPPNAALHRAIASGAPIAATFTRPSTHRSIQLKAPRAELARTTPPDGPSAMLQTRAFADELVRAGYSVRFATAYTRFEPHELAALAFLPESAFVQTPGPSAGSALTP